MDEAIQHSWSSQWGVQGRISATDASVPSSTVAYVAQAVVRAGRREGGSELRFRSAGPLPSLTRSWLLLSEHELLGLFPTPWARLALLPDASPSGNVPLWLGPEGRTTSTTLQVEPGVGRHLLTLGETGMGKSSLLVRLAVQATRHGGAVLFDPIGDTAERFLGALPESALDRTTLVSPTRSATGLNALGSAHGRVSGVDASGERRLGDLVHALRRVRAQHYGETPFWGPRIEETVTMALEAASGYPDGTLVTAFELLQGADRLGHGVPESARLLSAELRRRVAERPEDVEGARRLVAEVVRSAVLRRMICDAEARWSWEEALRPGQITVISGDAPHVGEQNSRYLLAVHLGLLWSSLVGRAVPSKLFVFLDEAQWYAHESAAEMLRMGRRFNLHLILATQALGSLPEGLRESALTNAGDLVIFRGSPADAREISRWVPDVPVDQILSLPRGQALVLCGKGREVLPTVIPLGTPPPDLPGRLSRVARQTLERFGTPGSPDTMVEGSPDPNPRPDLAPPRAGSTDPLQRRVRTTLAAGAWAAGPGGSIRVHLAKLREVADPDGAVVREMGNVLRTIGALIRVGRDSGGAFWVLDADKLCSDPSYTPTPEEKSAAETRWRNLTADGPARL